ncbi:MAG: pyridoxal-phosphate dependent enzyme [Caldilineae bacterium]|nr:MAG: pyridoxal-phosphate dependent enzyme [Caldilineae bacterium]
MPDRIFQLRCTICNQPVRWPPAEPRCPRPTCRGALRPAHHIPFDASLVEPIFPGMWRYRHMLPPLPDEPITLGEGGTPLLSLDGHPYRLFVKNESLNPTGSYKDRGAAMLVNLVGNAQVLVDDSSGNAGAALAAYAARAQLRARVYVPAAAPQAKLAQIQRYGAEVVPVEGDRDDVARAVERAAQEPEVFYASHVWHPGYALALQTIAWEIWEQLGRRAPHWVVLPTGNGTLLRGLRWGFRSLQKARLIEEPPRLVAVQAANCAPLYALSRGTYSPHTFRASPTIADGVAVPTPPLLDIMWKSVKKTRGRVVAVPEEEIEHACRQLVAQGFFVEPTAALPYAALSHLATSLQPHHTVVLLLTGHGFKTI